MSTPPIAAAPAAAADVTGWEALATAVADFNELLACELDHQTHRHDLVYEAAVAVISGLVEQVLASEVWLDGTALRPVGASTQRARLALAAHGSGQQQVTTDSRRLRADGRPADVEWVVCTPIRFGSERYGVLDVAGRGACPRAVASPVCRLVADDVAYYLHECRILDDLRAAREGLERQVKQQAQTFENLKHQLESPLLVATNRVGQLLDRGRLESRAAGDLRAVRGLCRKASRVGQSAGVFAALSTGRLPEPRLDLIGVDQLMRLLIAAADDAQQLGDPSHRVRFTVDRDSVRDLRRRLLPVDHGFLEQCVGNLLDNADKYSYDEQTVEIRGRALPEGFQIAVASTGVPIPPGDATRCLQRGFRGPAARGFTGEGSGLGLWIVDQLMGAMRGSVAILPDGDRTTVSLSLPYYY